GETPSPSFTVIASNHINAVVPPSASAGTVNVHVILSPTLGRASLWGGYTYTDRPAADAPSAATPAGTLAPVVLSATNQSATSVATRLPVPRAALQLIGSGKRAILKIDMEELQLAGASSAVVSVTLQKRVKVKVKVKSSNIKKGKTRKSKIIYRKIDSVQLDGTDVAAFTKIKIKSGYYRLVFNLEDSSKVVSKRFSITKKQISKTIRSSRA
ncbi:hypothetical protein N9P34_00855, partial [Actinomycetota bacterium]|nr:hypothetical protein [Actinomycetota bacterium]